MRSTLSSLKVSHDLRRFRTLDLRWNAVADEEKDAGA